MGIQAISSSTARMDWPATPQTQSSDPSAADNAAARTSTDAPANTKIKGAAPSRGPGPAPAKSSSGTASSANSAKIYDKRDANQDGTVSYQEAMLYALKHPADETESQTTVSNSQLQNGLSAYRQSQETGKTSLSAVLSAA